MLSVGKLYGLGIDLASNPKHPHTRWMLPLLLAFEAALCALIIMKVSCM